MKKTIILVIIFFSFIFISYKYFEKKENKNDKQITNKKLIKNEINSNELKISKFIFVPYWSKNINKEKLKEYEQIIYFGIKPQNIDLSLNNLNKIKYDAITLTMTDKNENETILDNEKKQLDIVNKSLQFVKEASASSLVIDLEMSPTLSSKTSEKITNFISKFKNKEIKIYMTLYGDNFFKNRPYDLAKLNKLVDGFYIMAYDFHRSNTEPGPNFPYEKSDKYSYDFKLMINDFLTVIPKNKISVVFGMYGYDWIVDEKKRPIKPASSISLNEIRDKFLKKCTFKNCVVLRDDNSLETEIDYIDEYLNYHIVWFEDERSVNKKGEYLKEKGINKIGFWAYEYF